MNLRRTGKHYVYRKSYYCYRSFTVSYNNFLIPQQNEERDEAGCRRAF